MTYIDPIGKLLGEWASTVTIWSTLLRLVLALLFAFLVGGERSTKGHTAGLKTFILLSLTTTACMIVDMCIGNIPYCSMAAIVGGAMLSGNAILFGAKNQIKGLTTSAWLWTCGIFGLIVGAGLYTIAIVLFAVYAVILGFFPALEKRLKQRSRHFEIHLELLNRTDLQDFLTTLRKLGMRVEDVEMNSAFVNSGLFVYSLRLSIESEELKKYKTHDELIQALRSIEYIHFIEEIN